MKSIISVKKLSKEFKIKKQGGSLIKNLFYPERKTVTAVKNISFKIDEGESVAFLGPNGAGKTTTTKMLSGLLYPTTGKLSVMGFEPFDRRPEFLRQIGLVMGNKAGLNWDLTPNQSFHLLKQIYRIPEAEYSERKKYLLNFLEVSKNVDTQVRKLSLGERMKMELIAAILHNPKILFLDEPTIGLDIIAKQRVREFLIKIQHDFNTTLLLTSHDMDDIEHVCKRVMIINLGEIILDQSLSLLIEKYRKERFVKFIFSSKKDLKKAKKLELDFSEVGSNFLTVSIPKNKMPQLVAEMSTRFELHDIDILSTPLEEIIADNFRKNGKND